MTRIKYQSTTTKLKNKNYNFEYIWKVFHKSDQFKKIINKLLNNILNLKIITTNKISELLTAIIFIKIKDWN